MAERHTNAQHRAHWPAVLRRAGVSLRPEPPSDEVFLHHLYHESRAEEVAAAGWPEAMAERFLDEQFRLQRAHFAANHADAEFFVILATARRATAPPEPIGRLYIDKSGATWRLLEIGLLQSWQGRGIGAALVGWIQQECTAAGAEAVALQVLHANPRATALYRRLGFGDAASLVTTHHGMIWRARKG